MLGLFDPFRAGTEKDQFAKAVFDELGRRQPGVRYKYRRAFFALERGRGPAVGLRPYFGRWRSLTPEERDRLVELIAKSSFKSEPNFTWEEAAIHFTPIVRRRHVSRQGQRYPPEDVTTRDVCGPIFAMLIIDAPGCRKMVSDGELQAWGKSFDEAFAIGLENLRGYSNEAFDHGTAVSMMARRDGYESSRILLPELFEDLPHPGRPVAVLVDPARVIIAGSASRSGLEAAVMGAKLGFENCKQPISPAPIVLEPEGWRMMDAQDDGFDLFAELVAYDQSIEASNEWD